MSSRSRVSSPNAANSGAASRTGGPAAVLALDMAADVANLRGPPVVIHAERLGTPVGGDLIEAGLDEREQRPIRGLLEAELDECRRLLRVIDGRVDGVRVPAEREPVLGLDSLDGHFHGQVVVAGMR